jgi:hypothetical protein
MADNTLTEKDEDTEELVPVETPPEDAEAEDDADEGEDEDERLAQSEDDSEEDIATSTTHAKRRKRREIQKRARDAARAEIEMLRRTVADLQQRVGGVESHAVSSNVQTLEARLQQATRQVEQAESIIASATEAGNGQDVVAAMRIRDQAIVDVQQLQQAREQLAYSQQQAQVPQVDPAVVNYARQWMEANPWYDPQGRDRDSAVTKAIDNELVRDGYNPTTREYWEELTSRVADAIGDEGEPKTTRRRAPPTGNTRQHAPASTRKEIYVTPERKQAMMEAGVWDDPVQRQRYLKAYQAYDNGSAR